MGKRAVYVRDADEPIWEKAQQLAGESMSALILDMLRNYVQKREEVKEGMERVEIEVSVMNDNGLPTGGMRKVAFQGRELASTAWRDANITAYLTAKGKFLFFYDSNSGPSSYSVYDDLEEAAEEMDYGADFLAEVAEAAGEEYVEELDI